MIARERRVEPLVGKAGALRRQNRFRFGNQLFTGDHARIIGARDGVAPVVPFHADEIPIFGIQSRGVEPAIMRKAVLLDLDGTLVDSTEAHAQAWSRAFERIGYNVPPERIRRWIGMGGEKLLQQVDPTLRDDRGPGKSISSAHQELFMHDYVRSLKPTNGARALLQRIGEEGLLRVIASSAKPQELKALLDVIDIQDVVDLSTNADDVDRSKPDPDIITEALAKAGVRPDEASYVGDTPYDVTAAHRAGVVAVAVTCGAWDAAELKGAQAVYRDPADLVRRFASSPLRGS